MHAKTIAGAAAALGALAALGAGVLWSSGARDSGSVPAERSGPPRHRGDAGGAERGVRAALDAPPVLDLRVVGADGTPARVRVLWSISSVAPLTPPFSPVPGGALPPSVRQRGVEGHTRLELPARHWTWVAAVWPRPVMAQRFVLLPPFAGRIERTLQLAPERRAIHAFVLDETLGAPAADATVRLLRGGLSEGGAEPFREVRTDAHGHARLADLPPGRYIALAPGAHARDTAPHRTAVVFPPQMGPTEIPIVLAVPERRAELSLHVVLAPQTRPTRSVRLLLQRMDDGTGTVIALRSALRPGAHEHRVEVAPGIYRFGSVPAGACRVVGGDPLITVPDRDSARARVQVELERDWTARVELRGLPRHRFPVQVYARREDEILQVPVDVPYLGRLSWRGAQENVPVMPGRHRLVVLGRGHAWLSRDLVALQPGAVPVYLVPATRVEVAWLQPSGGVPKAAMVLAESALCTITRAAARTMRPVGGRPHAMLAATLVVPHGTVVLRGQRHDRSETSWTRTLEARGSYVAVEVGG